MKKSIAIKTATLIAACGLMMMSSTASADRVHWSVNIGVPVAPPPVVYYNPPPTYLQPQPVYVQPQPVYVAPPPVVYYYDAYGRPYYRPYYRHHRHGW
jgi:hypothetical protein